MAHPRQPVDNFELNWCWYCAISVALVGSLCLLVGSASASWFRIEEWKVHYVQNFLIFDTSAITQKYASTTFGLYMVYFNGGVDVQPWYSRATQICAAVTDLVNAAAVNSIISLWDNSCSTDCINHFKARCQQYHLIASSGMVILIVIIIVSCLSITGAVWSFVFGRSKSFVTLAWLGGGLVCLVGSVVYILICKGAHTYLSAESQFPDFYLAYSAYVTIVGSVLLTIAGFAVLLVTWFDRRREVRARREEIIRQEAGGVNFRMPVTGTQLVRLIPPPRLPPPRIR